MLIRVGADSVIPRGTPLVAALGECSIDVMVDLLAGEQCQELLELLKPRGRYVVSGAIGGPIVELDVRTLYLKDLSFFGFTRLEKQLFPNLIGYIERGEIQPVVAKTYPLREIVRTQKDFLRKAHTGKLVLVPEQ